MSMRLFLLIVGLVILLIVFWAYSGRKLTAGISLLWMGFAVVAILFGIIPGWAWWADYLSRYVIMPILVIFLLFLLGLFLICLSVSNLVSRNRELAMQVSLLNEENERIQEEIEKLRRRERAAQEERERAEPQAGDAS